jgi:hypothetical protein
MDSKNGFEPKRKANFEPKPALPKNELSSAGRNVLSISQNTAESGFMTKRYESAFRKSGRVSLSKADDNIYAAAQNWFQESLRRKFKSPAGNRRNSEFAF